MPETPYRAICDFTAQQEGDLSFKKGDIIYVYDTNGNWWKGTCNGAYGLIPSNYVSLIE